MKTAYALISLDGRGYYKQMTEHYHPNSNRVEAFTAVYTENVAEAMTFRTKTEAEDAEFDFSVRANTCGNRGQYVRVIEISAV